MVNWIRAKDKGEVEENEEDDSGRSGESPVQRSGDLVFRVSRRNLKRKEKNVQRERQKKSARGHRFQYIYSTCLPTHHNFFCHRLGKSHKFSVNKSKVHAGSSYHRRGREKQGERRAHKVQTTKHTPITWSHPNQGLCPSIRD
uniref:ARAD1C10582p n=1 Tax=Blastobotrys adeninivorans TaxID=409370 RepID=A0A060T5A9_BLAAD